MSDELVKQLREDADFVDAVAYDGCWEIKETERGQRLRAAATRIETLESERREISMTLGNQPDEPVTAAELIENIERISRIAGQGVLKISALEGRQRVLFAFVQRVAEMPDPFERLESDIDGLYANESLFAAIIGEARAALAGDAPTPAETPTSQR